MKRIYRVFIPFVFSLFCGPSMANSSLTLMQALDKSSEIEQEQVQTPEHYQYRDPLSRDTPRGALQGFFKAAWEQDYLLATEYLDLRFLPEGMSSTKGEKYARDLQAILDRNLWIDLDTVNDTPQGNELDNLPAYRDAFARIQAGNKDVVFYLQRVPDAGIGSIWKISNATLAQVPALYEKLGYGPWVEWFIAHVPEGRLFKFTLWEWAFMVAFLAVSLLLALPVTWVVKWLLLRTPWQHREEAAKIVTGPMRFFLAVLLNKAAILHTTLPVMTKELIDTGVFLMLTLVWLLWSLMGLMQSVLKARWTERGSKQAASLLRPLTNFFRILTLVLASLIWMQHLGFNVGAILAGMGIGGIALALASKQSIENFIGTVTLYSSAPLKVGNLCKLGSLRGTVEEIGLRCTRIRTLDRSVIHIPNAKLAEMEIENISEREKIRFKTDIRLDYNTSAEQIKQITDDIKALLETTDKVNDKPLRVTFSGFGLHGLEINVFAYVGTTSLPTYQQVAHELNLGIMEIVAKHGSRVVPAMAPVAP
ncbi:mechanosensitive ion channel family protein [Shewanella litorisediminis]|uniref:Mechanosensitive ion channel family protein n=2 Tax=Shewanella litorisediminis TaxID=1173586 RepID=A0ABX7G7P5_9GAMM|nr:mechanosensitive ion channel family protein [Shewanella litorisediminis]QRH03286.1 mechanosensitive ion channel family protein [Shewanella litorisediminis]